MSRASFAPGAESGPAGRRGATFTPGYTSPVQGGLSGIGLSGKRRTD